MRDILIRGAREHDLDLDLDLRGGVWTGVVGVSGSGKTSLVFDTLVREGRRRFLQGTSPRARRQLGKLGSADVDVLEGLPVPLAIGAGRLTRFERSTVGTLSGLLDVLRLIYARQGTGGPHRRGDFSFNSTGACPTCDGLGTEETIDLERVVVHPERSIRDGALGPTLPNGYTVYSQVTLEVMDTVCRAHGFDVHTPWQDLTDDQRDVVLYGTTALTVPFGKHSLESRLKWEGITARPREEGHYRGIVPVMQETLRRSRNANILRYATSVPCPTCGGTRLADVGRSTTVGGRTLPDVCRVPLDGLLEELVGWTGPVVDALLPAFRRRVGTAVELGLGHLSLDRTSTTLSDGELQRLRLVGQLGVELSGMLVAFDEPTLGLHPSAHNGLATALRRLQEQGNTLVTVEHAPGFVEAADHLVELGPGAGRDGGRVVRDVSMPSRPLGNGVGRSRQRWGEGDLVLRGACLHGLDTDLTLRRGVLNVVCGPSGAGKSSLVFGTLLPVLEGRPARCDGLEGAEGLGVRAVDARPLGRTPRSTPATYTGLFDVVRRLFAGLPEAREQGLTASHFSHNHKAGRCPVCEGLGVERVGLHLMRDVERVCSACGGGRYAETVLGVRYRGHSVADVLALPILEARDVFVDVPTVQRMLDALVELGLGHLPLGRSTTAISRGEAQRIKLATLLGRPDPKPTVVLLDEPDRGLHPADLERLLRGLQALVDGGHTLVAISHHPDLWRSADHLVEVRQGRASVLEEPPEAHRFVAAPRPPAVQPGFIELSGVRTRNLQGVDVRFPHGAVTGVCGVSGSGKSSLVFDTLAAEAERRFAESLPFEVRRHLRRVAPPALDGASGLTPTLVLAQRDGSAPRGSTVATLSGLGPELRLLFSREGQVDGRACGLPAEAFSRRTPVGRCPTCVGRATRRVCSPGLLVTHPDRSIREGALAGTKPGRFFGEVGGRHLALLGALAGDALLDTPWSALTDDQRRLALDGSTTVVRTIWRFERGKRSGEHPLEEPWTGFLSLVTVEAVKRSNRKDAADWWAPFEELPCPDCQGTGLAVGPRSVLWGGVTLPELLTRTVGEVRALVARTPSALGPLTGRIDELLGGLEALGLADVPLDRDASALSDGELQRLRLSEVLATGLSGLTVVLDEPAAGLDDAGVAGVLARIRRLVRVGNTVVLVSHQREVLAACDHLVELGPGAGPDGGRIVGEGTDVLTGDGPTARAFRAATPASGPETSVVHRLTVTLPSGPREVGLPKAGVVGVTGPSGSGKSLLLDRLAAAVERGDLPGFREVVRPLPSGSETLGFALGWMRPLQKRFAAASDLPAKTFSFKSPAGRCPVCKGAGVERVALDVLADVSLVCPACDGTRYGPDARSTTWEGQTIDQVLGRPLADLTEDLVVGGRAAAVRLGIGHLSLGMRLADLSGGERQRVTLLKALLGGRPRRLFLLDGPERGLHPLDVARTRAVLKDLASAGDLVVLAASSPGLWHPDVLLALG